MKNKHLLNRKRLFLLCLLIGFGFLSCAPTSEESEETIGIQAGSGSNDSTGTKPLPPSGPGKQSPGDPNPINPTPDPTPVDTNILTMLNSDVALPILIDNFTDVYAQLKVTVNKTADVTIQYKVKKSDDGIVNQGSATASPVGGVATFNILVMPTSNNYSDDTYTVEFSADNKLAPSKTVNKNIRVNLGCRTKQDTIFKLKISAKRVGMQGSIFQGFDIDIKNSGDTSIAALNKVFYNRKGSTPDSGYEFRDETITSLQNISDSGNSFSATQDPNLRNSFTITKVMLEWTCWNGSSTSLAIYDNATATLPVQFSFSRP